MDDYLNVDTDELEVVRRKMKTNGETFEQVIEHMIKTVNEKLINTWEGEDATEFCKNINDYLEKMQKLPKNIKEIQFTMNKTSLEFQDKDDEYAKDLDKEANNYDEYEIEDNELQ